MKYNSDAEKYQKTRWINENIICDIIFVPYNDSKTKYAKVNGNYLVDDNLSNIIEWNNNGEIGIYFESNDYQYKDDEKNKFVKITKLVDICNIIREKIWR